MVLRADGYDVLVVGAGTGGWPAAIGAARAGARVLLVEEDQMAGGAPVDNYVTMPCGKYLSGVYRELVEALEARHRLPVADNGPIPELWSRWFLPSAFAIEIQRLIRAEPNITYLGGVRVQQPLVERCANTARLSGAIIPVNGRELPVRAHIVIDATGDGAFAECAGAQAMYGSEARDCFDEPSAAPDASARVQQCTIMYISQRLGNEKLDFQALGLNRGVDPEFGWLDRDYAVAMARSCGIYLTWGGTVACADTRETTALSQACAEALAKVTPHVEKLHAHQHLVHLAPKLGVREVRRIVGEELLSEGWLRAGKMPEDTVAIGNWFLDNWGGELSEDQRQVPPYGIPLRALLPKGTTHLAMACRAISISHLAFSSWRVQPTVAAAGQAVGVAAALAARRKCDIRDLDWRETFRELESSNQGWRLALPSQPQTQKER